MNKEKETPSDLKTPDYRVINAEISRNHTRRNAELQGADKEGKHRAFCAGQVKKEVTEKQHQQDSLVKEGVLYQQVQNEKGAEENKRRQRSRRR